MDTTFRANSSSGIETMLLCVLYVVIDRAEEGGIVPQRRNLWHRVDMVNLGALISKQQNFETP